MTIRRWARRPDLRGGVPTFFFADLVGYTRLTELRGDEAGAEIAREFRRTMCALSRDHEARQIKSMGEVAARLASEAEPNEALVSEVTWTSAACRLTEPVDARRDLVLKGIDRQVAAWRLA